jgi:hypothetical protein
MPEILYIGVRLLVKACPQLSRIELHAEARDFEGGWFEVVVVAGDSSGHNTRQTAKINDDINDINDINATNHFLSDMQDMTSTLASRRSARIWRKSLTSESLLRTRWYAEIQQLSGLQEAVLMLTQTNWFWEGHTHAEETNFSFNLWKIRWMFLRSATRPRWGRSDLLFSLENGDGDGGFVSGEQSQDGGDVEEHRTQERNAVTARL